MLVLNKPGLSPSRVVVTLPAVTVSEGEAAGVLKGALDFEMLRG